LIYFASIGAGFMCLQIGLLQLFSVFLGHPTYAYPIILFSMILFAGVGSVLSDRLSLEGRRWHWGIPLLAGFTILALLAAIPPLIEAAIGRGLATRAALVVTVTAPLSLLLGCCFPVGIRLLERLSHDAGAWAWGVNGGFGVLASISAVGVSLAWGIHVNFVLAAGAYALVALAAIGLSRVSPAIGGVD
jgi:hypothetical protein